MTYTDLTQAAANVPDFDLDELLEPRQAVRAQAVVTQCRADLDRARKAIAARPGVPTAFTLEYFDDHAPTLTSMRKLANAFQLESHLAARAGELDTAIKCCLDIVHLAHCQRRNGLNVDMLAACAIWSKGISGLVALRSQMNAEQRRRLSWQLIESEVDIEPAITITARDAVWSASVKYPPLDEEQLRKDMSNDLASAHVNRLLSMISEAEATPPAISQQLYFNTSDRSLAYQRLLVIELAITNFMEQHHRAPESLNELVPEFLLTSLPDPFTNTDFVYRIERGQYLLYSIGEKRHDLGGVRGSWVEAISGAADMFLE